MSFTFSTGTTTVNTEISASLVFNDDNVAAVYIDWDDGADNYDNANYQWLQFDRPLTSTSVNHTYNSTGTFRPIIQTINNEGYVSRYYSERGTAPAGIAPFTSGSTMDTIIVSDGDPVGITRVQNTEIRSGIDNSLLDRPKDIFATIPPTESEYGGMTPVLEVVAEVTLPTENATSGSNYQLGYSVKTLTIEKDIENSNRGMLQINTSGTLIRSIKKVKFKNPKLDDASFETERQTNALKIFVITSGSDGLYYPITYVSMGSPIKRADDSRRNYTLDFSQGRTAAANTSVSNYYYDLGKSWFNPINKWAYTSSPPTMRISSPSGTNTTKSSTFTYMPRPGGLNYIGEGVVDSNADYVLAFATGNTYSWLAGSDQEPRTDQFPLTNTNQFFDQYHLIRSNLKTNTDKYSYIKGFNGVFRICPATTWSTGDQSPIGGRVPGSITKLYERIGSSWPDGSPRYSEDFTKAAYDNYSGTYATGAWDTGASGMVSMNNWNGLTFNDRFGNTRPASEYFLTLLNEKYDKVFFNCSPYSPKLQSDPSGLTSGNKIVGVSYLKVTDKATPLCEMVWEPLEFDDYTITDKEYRNTDDNTYNERQNSLSKSGYVSFNQPEDWTPVTVNDVMGMAAGSTWGGAENSGPVGVSGNTSDYEIPVYASCSATGGGAYGKWAKFGDLTFTNGETYTEDQIGAYKFGAILSSGTMGAGSVLGQWYWVASGASGSGYDGSTMTLQVGTYQFNASNMVQYGSFVEGNLYQFKLRKTNIYNVLDGASKVWSNNPTTITPDLQAPNITDGNPWPNLYNLATGSIVGSGMNSKWGDTEMYPVKVIVSGGYMASGTAATSRVGPEVWNILPAGGNSNQIIKEVDDHAYSLNKLPLNSDMGVSREGVYYQAITRKGKVFISRTGTPIQSIGFSSVALGDESSDTAFSKYGSPSDTYGQLRTIRSLQENNRRAYWDFKQKDGTYVRFFGVIVKVDENRGVGGPRAIMNYTFDMTIEDVAIIDANMNLISDLFPIGGIENARDYT